MSNLNFRYLEDRDTIKEITKKATVPKCVEHLTPMQSQAFSFLSRNNNVFIRAGRRTGKTTLLSYMLINALRSNSCTTSVFVAKSQTYAAKMKTNIMNELKRLEVEYFFENDSVMVGSNRLVCTNISRHANSIRGYNRISEFYVDNIDLMGKPYLHSLVNEWVPIATVAKPKVIMTCVGSHGIEKDKTISDYITSNLSYFSFNGGLNVEK